MIIEIHYDLCIFSSQFQIQRVNALYFIANSNATGAQNASIPVDNKKIMSGIYLVAGPVSLEHDVIYP